MNCRELHLRKAFDAIDQYRPLIRVTLLRAGCRDDDEMHDVTVDLGLLLARKRSLGKVHDADVRGWLIVTSRYLANNLARLCITRRRHVKLDGALLARATTPATEPYDDDVDNDRRAAIAAAMSTLRRQERNLVMQRFVAGRPAAAIRRSLHLRRRGFAARVRCALAKLRKCPELAAFAPADFTDARS